MNKISEPERFRAFLIDKLPEPLTPASSHLQLTDRYIADTAIRLRSIRDPQSKAVNYSMQKKTIVRTDSGSYSRSEEMHLTDNEYATFARFMGRELRKNRYFHEFDRRLLTFDIYLGELSGLGIVRVDLTDNTDFEQFEPPPFAVFEVSEDPFFDSDKLAGNTFPQVKVEVERIGHEWPAENPYQDE